MSKILIYGLLIQFSTGMESSPGEKLMPRMGRSSGILCEDKDKECKNFADKCDKYEYVRNYCPVTCQMCTFVDLSNCADNHPYWCKHKKSLCTSSPSVTKACKETCGLCSNKCQDITSTRKCIEYSKMGYCRFSKMVQLKCKKTCERCVVDTCIDSDEACPTFIEECEDLFVQNLCRKTCKKCFIKEKVAEKSKGRGCDCGYENVQSKLQNSPSGYRIVGGTEAGKHSLPWMAYIVNEKVAGSPRCGGSILNSRYVLTAAHCTYESNCETESKADHFIVTVAEHNVDSINDDIRGVTEKITVEKIIRHEKYCMSPKKPFDNDIALFRVSKDIELLEYPEIGIICLPKLITDDFYSSKVMAAGWGFVKKGTRKNNRFASTLQVVNINRYHCGIFPNQDEISDNMICAGDQGNIRDTCGGDSGGPLTVRIDLGEGRVRHVQIGIVSFGLSTGTCHGWGVYTKVQNYLDWINFNIQDGSCDNVTDAGYQTIPDEELEKHKDQLYFRKGKLVNEDGSKMKKLEEVSSFELFEDAANNEINKKIS